MTSKKKSKMYYLMTPDEYIQTPDSQLPKMAMWEGLKERTTSHGIPQVDTAAGKIKRLIWIFVTLGTIAALIYNLEEIVKKFIKHDIVVVVQMYHLKQQQFPAVTFCNMNPFRKSKVEENVVFAQLLGTNVSSTASVKRRRKRFIETPNCDVSNLHTPSGYCFALATYNGSVNGELHTWPYRDFWYNGNTLCSDNWDMAVLDTEDKYLFVKNHPDIFSDALSGGKYWLNGKYDLPKGGNIWFGSANNLITWGAWKNGFPRESGCVYADINDTHKWGQGSCSFKYMVLCQLQDHIPTTPGVEETTTPLTTEPDTTTPVMTTTTKPTTVEETTTQLQTTTKPITTQAETTPALTTIQPTTVEDTTAKVTTTMQPTTTTQVDTTSVTTTTLQPTTVEDTTTEETTKAQPVTSIGTTFKTTYMDTTLADTTHIDSTLADTTLLDTSVETETPTYTTLTDTTFSDKTTEMDTTYTTLPHTILTDYTLSETTLETDTHMTDTTFADTTLNDIAITGDIALTDTTLYHKTSGDPTFSDAKLIDTTLTDNKMADTILPDTSTDDITVAPPTLKDRSITDISLADISMTDITKASAMSDTSFSDVTVPAISITENKLTSITKVDTSSTDTISGNPSSDITPFHKATSDYIAPHTSVPQYLTDITHDHSSTSALTDNRDSSIGTDVTTTSSIHFNGQSVTSSYTTHQSLLSTASGLTASTQVSSGIPESITSKHINDQHTSMSVTMRDPLQVPTQSNVQSSSMNNEITQPTHNDPTSSYTKGITSVTKAEDTSSRNVVTSTSGNGPFDTVTVKAISEKGSALTSAVNGATSMKDSSTTTVLTTTTEIPVITTYKPPPAPAPKYVEGSVFPERIQTTPEFSEEEKTLEALANIPEEVKKSLGYTASQFIVDCEYAGFACHTWEFSYFYNAIHGNCYTFNSGWNSSIPLQWSHQTGPRYGLKVVLNIDQDEYTKKFGEAAGVRVLVHSQAKMPFPEDEGSMARTGQLTSVGITKMSINKLGQPYTSCFSVRKKNFMRNVYEEYYNVNYTTLACFKTCYQRYVIQTCGCGDMDYPLKGEAFGNVKARACNSSNIIEDDCKYNITKLYAANKLQCDCEDPCQEDVYIPGTSEMSWPSDMSKAAFIARNGYKIEKIAQSNDSNKFRSNLAKVEVYFQSFDVETIEEKASYSDVLFFVDIGGSMGLWIGWSLVTAFEFIEFFTDLIILTMVKRKFNKTSQSEKVDKVEGLPPKPPVLPRRSLHYIHQDSSEMKTLRPPPQTNLATLNESHRDSGISSASSMEDDRAIIRSKSRRASKSRITYHSRRESIRPMELRESNLSVATSHH